MLPILRLREYEPYDKNIGQVDRDISIYLDSLSAIFAKDSDPDVHTTCVASLELLRESFPGIAAGSDSSVVFFWPVLVLPDSITMLEGNQQEALLVLASFCILLDTQNWCWLFRGWPSNMLETIEGLLDMKWREWLMWPLQVMKRNNSSQNKGRILELFLDLHPLIYT
jgi:hypothetical protein